jgi:hypothetical protein
MAPELIWAKDPIAKFCCWGKIIKKIVKNIIYNNYRESFANPTSIFRGVSCKIPSKNLSPNKKDVRGLRKTFAGSHVGTLAVLAIKNPRTFRTTPIYHYCTILNQY